MKHLFLSVLALCSLALLAEGPTATDLEKYYNEGQVCVCIKFAEPVCNDIVWCGTYNGWSTNIWSLYRFQPVDGFDGWWVVAFDDDSENIKGKVVQLKRNGSFDWQYQTGNWETWTIVSGTASLEYNNEGQTEAQLCQIGKAEPVIAISSGWKNDTRCTPYSGTLPVMYINTKESAPIESKEDYVEATYYLDNLGLKGYKSIASQDLPDTLQIKGRGNYTWKDFDKKPYRIKLNKKTALMGLEKSKHWTLLAHADDQFCWLKNTVGFLLSEQIGLKWTPKQAPVEVVLNGDYVGLYMLTEQVRVDKKRVNIVEQADEETNDDKITGGWLVEIDNYEEPYHATVTEPANQWHEEQTVWVTPKTPEVLSTPQSNYLQGQMEAINNAIYGSNDTTLSEILDISEAAKYYLVCELMSDCESYHGSCYLHKNVNDNVNVNQKWYFGPAWDFGNSFNDRNMFIYDDPLFSQVWIGELASHQVFKESLDTIWKEWKQTYYSSINTAIDSFATLVAEAAEADAERWPQYDHSNVQQGKTIFQNYFHTHVAWLTTQWEVEDQTGTEMQNAQCTMHNEKILIDGQLYIIRNEKVYTILGSR